MPATPARIGFITNEFRLATAGPVSSVEMIYGSKARDTKEPVETFFEDQADAQVMADERLALLSAQRTMLTIIVAGIETGYDLDFSQGLPTVHVVDDELNVDRDMLVVGVKIDHDQNRTFLTCWG